MRDNPENGVVAVKHLPSGIGAKLILNLHTECSEPRPLGDRLYILDGRVRRNEEAAKEAADGVQMAYSYGPSVCTAFLLPCLEVFV